MQRVIRINSKGVKTFKMKCGKGMKWNPDTGKCERMSGKEILDRRMAIRKALLTKRNEGAAFKRRVMLKRKKALRFRKLMGLKV